MLQSWYSLFAEVPDRLSNLSDACCADSFNVSLSESLADKYNE